ncbi:EAL domain-containing protein [Marinomonas spartinae]|uniref:bifunctional diguanylate cyclase/phosphodiesterase n=1 Tax=Marinomonas spartinae TaxID=1792290 RepID=UPI0018F21600|nr:EAL domain-containing protein [Marinomonas spartinae]MBJ7552890.1 EAL domain-containing protein [Marinomonas spartinae]
MILPKIRFPFVAAICLCLFTLLSTASIYFVHTYNSYFTHEQKILLDSVIQDQKAILQRHLSLTFTSTQILAYNIQLNQGYMPYFNKYAKNIIDSISSISSLQLAPKGIIEKIYPPKGNEAAIGLNILKSPPYNELTDISIRYNKAILTSPVQLIQGGRAVIYRVPVSITNSEHENYFWGFVSAVINLNVLISNSRFSDLEQQGYQYKILYFKTPSHPIVVAQSSEPIGKLFSTRYLSLPSGQWQLRISHSIPKNVLGEMQFRYTLALVIPALISLFFFYMLLQPTRLKRLVNEKTQELEKLAYEDPLTGLPNRRFLTDKLQHTIFKQKKKVRRSAFIYFDLDNFKRINDSIGHDIGDQVLVLVAERLLSIPHQKSHVVRLGGDEFCIYLSDVDGHHEVSQYAEQVLQIIQKPVTIYKHHFMMSTSLGIAMVPDDGQDLISIMQHSDMALYRAKQLGKNQYAFYTKNIKDNTMKDILEEDELHRALSKNEFELFYQPQFNLSNGKIFSAEALIRWHHPERGRIGPDAFIPLAERTGLIIDIGYWVIETSIAFIAQRHQDRLSPICIHINLSALQLRDAKLVKQVSKLLDQYQVSPKEIGFEVTETALLSDITLASNILQTFKNMGISIAIDDFGVGFSSLGQLKNLPVNVLKIDKSFVDDLETNPNDKKIVEAIIAMAHKLSIHVVAEGIENETQWRLLEDYSCEYGQGYIVSRPLPKDAFNALVEKNKQAYRKNLEQDA